MKSHLPATRPHTQGRLDTPQTTIYFNGLGAINIKGEASARSDLWYSENDKWNVALRIDLKNPTHQIGELAGVCWAIKGNPYTQHST